MWDDRVCDQLKAVFVGRRPTVDSAGTFLMRECSRQMTTVSRLTSKSQVSLLKNTGVFVLSANYQGSLLRC